MLSAIRLALCALLWLTTAASAEPVTISGVTFPDRVGEFARGPSQDYEKSMPGAGHSFAYFNRPWIATVYVYDQQRAGIPNDPASNVIRAEFAAAKNEIMALAQRGAWRKADFVRDFSLPARGKARFACANYTLLNNENVVIDSTLCITGSKGRYVKFRVSGPRDGADLAVPARFVESWSAMLAPGA